MKLKKFASIGALIVLLVSAAFIAGCKQDANSGGGGGSGDNVANPFIGTWEISTGLNRLVFNATTVTDYYRTSSIGDWQFGASVPYTFSGNTATPQVSGGTPYTFTVSGNTLTGSNGEIFYKK